MVQEKAQAGIAANGVSGVFSVTNDLPVSPWPAFWPAAGG